MSRGRALRRNVLFITVDQWRGDSLSCMGHDVVQTPNIDSLAAGGVLFADHWANAAPCGPSRACLFTGMYMQNHRSVLNGTPLDARFTNLALEARRAGYDPVLFGYTDTSVDPRTVPAGDPRTFTYEGVLPGFTPDRERPLGTRRHRMGQMAGRARHRRPVRAARPLRAGHVVSRCRASTLLRGRLPGSRPSCPKRRS